MKQKVISLVLKYFRFFAKLQLKKNSQAKIIGITGSAGKTSTRNAIAAALQATGKKVKVSYKANSETGIPLNILGLTPKRFSYLEWLKLIILCPIKLLTNWESFDYYVVEMGIDGPYPPKNMEYLLTIIKPDIGVLLNAAPMHSEPFDHLIKTSSHKKRATEVTKLIAKEKGKIVTDLKSTQVAVINFDQKEFSAIKKNTQAKIIGFGTKKEAEVKLLDYQVTKNGTTFSFTTQKKTAVALKFKNMLLPEHFNYTFAATLATGRALGISNKKLKSGIEKNFSLPPGRATLLSGIKGSFIIDSSYNSSAKPTLDMLELLKQVTGEKKYAILGDIRELGKVAQLEHEKVAEKAAKVCDEVFLVGPQMKEHAIPVLKKSSTPVHWFATAYAAAQSSKKVLKKNDFILIKGSQNTLLLEIAVEELLKNKEDKKLLARRGKFWDKKRKELIPE